LPHQRTIAEKIVCRGIGLHSGEPVELVMTPAAAGTGVVFVRRDGDRLVEIPARAEFVCSTTNATTLSRDGVQVATVEHLLAALRALDIDNLRIEVDAAEIPVMDGSAASFADGIRAAGSVAQAPSRRVMVVCKSVSYTNGLRSIGIEPAKKGLRVSYAVDFEHPAIGRQVLDLPDLTPACFEAELARARTFGFHDQVEALRSAGLARGASLDNTIVLGEDGVMNPGGLRFPDEFVRHKVVDLLGDLSLLGHRVRGHVRVERGGHGLHRALVDALLADPSSWKLVSEAAPQLAAMRDRAGYAYPI
jgi:UDP-3-O-[3-hydroxymyristoyl] N-acetylglucosamine deacetylase